MIKCKTFAPCYVSPLHCTDQYLQWDSHHNLCAKYSVIGTLTHRATTVCTRPELFQKELQHLREALASCKYPNWSTKRVQSKYINSNQEDNTITPATKKTTIHKTSTTPAQAQKKPPTSWIAPTLHKTLTIQAQTQKKLLYKAKTQHGICGYPLHPRNSWTF